MKAIFVGLFRFLGSFGLAVSLLVCLFLLTWLGTLEQVEHGLYEVQKRYFESWVLVHWLGPVPIPLLGGRKVMGLFAINLLVGGILRIRWNWRNSGVIVAHLGMVWLMAAGAVKQVASEDGLMKLRPQQRDSVFESPTRHEVVIWDATEAMRSNGATSSPITEHRIDPDDVRVLTGSRTRTFTSDQLPFDLALSNFVAHARVVPAVAIGVPVHPVIDNWTVRPEAPGSVDAATLPAIYATITTPSGRREQGILWAAELVPWTFELEGRTWAVALRRELYDLPFELRLDAFRAEFHPGMGMARAFESDVTRLKGGEPDRQVLIEMNQPLREDGYIAYQAQWDEDPDGVRATILQIVRNPSDQWPKYACYVITLGLLAAFSLRLYTYLGNERRRRAREATA